MSDQETNKKFVERDWDDISTIRHKHEEAKEEMKKPEEVKKIVEKKEPVEEAKPKETKPAPTGPSAVLDDMKKAGISGAILREDGVLIHSTMPLTDTGAGLLASVSNVSDAIMKRAGDTPREFEMTFQSQILVIIPFDNYLFCGMVKDREQKKTIREFATKAKASL